MPNQQIRHTALTLAALLPTNYKEALAVLAEIRALIEWQAGHPIATLQVVEGLQSPLGALPARSDKTNGALPGSPS
jgi:hypothetical protein